MKCPKCDRSGAKKLRPLIVPYLEQGLPGGVPNFVRVNEPIACPDCGLLLLFGDSFNLPDTGLLLAEGDAAAS